MSWPAGIAIAAPGVAAAGAIPSIFMSPMVDMSWPAIGAAAGLAASIFMSPMPDMSWPACGSAGLAAGAAGAMPLMPLIPDMSCPA